MKKNLFLLFCLFCLFPNGAHGAFVKVLDGHLSLGGEPYYYIGTNFWYGPVLASSGPEGNRQRLSEELDLLHASGMDNLRILVGADGPDNIATKVRPALQTAPGKYNEALLDGLDYLLYEMGKRGMHAVLYLNNSWEWSGGYSQYLNWAGQGPIPYPHDVGWGPYQAYVKQFATNAKAQELFLNHVKFIVSRTNRYTGKPYADDEAIMAWQVGNEPRAFGSENKVAFVQWMRRTTALIRSLDNHHLISTGSEGYKGSENDILLWKKIHSDPNIDYVNIHIWPKNWRWIDMEHILETLPQAISKTLEYIHEHETLARGMKKPLVLEEFGLPRDGFSFTPNASTKCRDNYYSIIFEQILFSARTLGTFAGCNCWAWGGKGRPAHEFWQPGDDYLGDPAQEEQGINSVFDSDSTVQIIASFNRRLQQACSDRGLPTDSLATPETRALYANLKQLARRGFMFGQQDATLYGIGWKYDANRSDCRSVCGDYPAVYGWEIGDIELGDKDVSLDSIHFTKIREHILQAYARGGVNTLSWHARNPLTGGGVSEKTTLWAVETILPGGTQHEKFNAWLNRVADFIQSLVTPEGIAVPIIFRPWHEHSGNWFWWGNDKCTAEQYQALYRYTVHYLRDVRGIHQILWAYSPDIIRTHDAYFEKFPGYEWVDILGIDMYHRRDSRQEYIDKVQNALSIIFPEVKRHGKVMALTEMGQNMVPDAEWWTKVMIPALSGYEVSYGLVWRNAYDRADHYFGTYPGQVSAPDFCRFAATGCVLMEHDLPDMYHLQ